MAAPQAGRDTRIGLAQQSTFGTAIADASAFDELYVDATQIKQDIKVREIPGLHATRQMQTGDQTHDIKGVLPLIDLAGEVSRNDFDKLAYAYFQKVVETGSTPYKKVFTFPATQPDFLASAGFFATLIDRHVDASKSHKLTDVICKSLSMSLKAGERLKFSASMIGRGQVNATSNPSGTWTAQTYAPYHFEDLARWTVDFGSGAQALTASDFDVKMDQDVMPVGQASANVQTFGISKRSGTINITSLYDSTQYASAKTAAETGALCTVNIGWGNATPGSVSGDLDLTFTCKFKELTEDKGGMLMMTFDGTLLASSNSTSFAQLILANAVQRSW